jgi:hypothetical protein
LKKPNDGVQCPFCDERHLPEQQGIGLAMQPLAATKPTLSVISVLSKL